jgi:hypothetical protein
VTPADGTGDPFDADPECGIGIEWRSVIVPLPTRTSFVRAGLRRQQCRRRCCRRPGQGGCGGRHALRGGLGNSPVGEDAVSTLQKFLNSVLNVPRSGVLLFVHTIADVPVDGVPVVRGVRVGNDRRRAFDKRISPTSAQQLKQAETAAGEVDRSENQRAGRARPNRHHTTLAFIAPVAEDGVGRVATL